MFESISYLTKLQKYLEKTMSDDAYGIDVITRFNNNYMYYPVHASTVCIGLKKVDLTYVASAPAGTMELSIGIHSARDRGLYSHLDLVDGAINALGSFSDFSISGLKVGEADFDRTHSSICTEIVCSVNFGQ